MLSSHSTSITLGTLERHSQQPHWFQVSNLTTLGDGEPKKKLFCHGDLAHLRVAGVVEDHWSTGLKDLVWQQETPQVCSYGNLRKPCIVSGCFRVPINVKTMVFWAGCQAPMLVRELRSFLQGMTWHDHQQEPIYGRSHGPLVTCPSWYSNLLYLYIHVCR